ncbi:MAG: putative 2OG-Fe(II) oxygenase [Rudaea sp.]|uniref:putative 2OG-Fe(II) oxygenase n=1 Tax=Rudaea sp. TaxID=2136325 RepID=UPI0039E41FDE
MAASSNRPLSAAQATRLRQAFALLQSGNAAQALALAWALVREAPDCADAQQLLGLCLAETGQPADEAFRRALALHDSPLIAANYATWLRKQQRFADAVGVLENAPTTAQIAFLLGSTLLTLHDHVRAAKAFECALALQPSAQAWHGLGSALHGSEDWEVAAAAFRKAIELDADYAPAWVNLAAVQRLLGRLDEATQSFRRAQALGHDTAEVRNALVGLHADAGRSAQALQGARELARAFPADARTWETLTDLLWEHGAELAPGEDPLAALQDAAQAQPDNEPLQFTLARLLRAAQRDEAALAALQTMRRRGQGGRRLDWFEADARDALGQFDKAQALFETAQRTFGDDADFLNAYARHAFRSQRFELARDCAARAVRVAPRDQEAWANLGTAWRLLGDAREYWLFGYENLVGYDAIEPPPGFADLPAFLAALAQTLHALHNAVRQPLHQSVRGGSQTSGLLFGRDDPVIRAAETALRAAVEKWLATLPGDDTHPFLSRRRRSVRFAGSWSVRLQSAGHHSSHIHNKGWMSSAFYVSLPPSVAAAAADGGAPGSLHLGKPLETLGLDLPPRRIVRPQAGHLALFPSYLWHGTVPFADDEPRLTLAFDVLPA